MRELNEGEKLKAMVKGTLNIAQGALDKSEMGSSTCEPSVANRLGVHRSSGYVAL